MKHLQYVVRIEKEPDSDWGAWVPDLPGCVATGKTIDSVLKRIEKAIEMHLAGLREDGVTIPRPHRRVLSPRQSARGVDFYATVRVAA